MTRPSDVMERIEMHLRIAPDEGWFNELELHKTDVARLNDYIVGLEKDLSLLAELRAARKEYEEVDASIRNYYDMKLLHEERLYPNDLLDSAEETRTDLEGRLNRLRNLVELG